jgi:uncharacterized protein YbjT (DUF2867 family)
MTIVTNSREAFSMTIGITAASGQLGHLVIDKLKAKVPASAIVALARHPEKAADLGVTVREADYSRPETLGPALAGVDTCSSSPRAKPDPNGSANTATWSRPPSKRA